MSIKKSNRANVGSRRWVLNELQRESTANHETAWPDEIGSGNTSSYPALDEFTTGWYHYPWSELRNILSNGTVHSAVSYGPSDVAIGDTVFENTGTILTLGFGSSLTQGAGDEAWGIDDLVITIDGNEYLNDDFAQGAPSWSDDITNDTLGGNKYLGYLGRTHVGGTYNDNTKPALTYSFHIPPGVQEMVFSFTFYEIGTWDGEHLYAFINGELIDLGSYRYTWMPDEPNSASQGNISWVITDTGQLVDDVEGNNIFDIVITVTNPTGTGSLIQVPERGWGTNSNWELHRLPSELNSTQEGYGYPRLNLAPWDVLHDPFYGSDVEVTTLTKETINRNTLVVLKDLTVGGQYYFYDFYWGYPSNFSFTLVEMYDENDVLIPNSQYVFTLDNVNTMLENGIVRYGFLAPSSTVKISRVCPDKIGSYSAGFVCIKAGA